MLLLRFLAGSPFEKRKNLNIRFCFKDIFVLYFKNLHSFQNHSLVFVLKIFLKFSLDFIKIFRKTGLKKLVFKIKTVFLKVAICDILGTLICSVRKEKIFINSYTPIQKTKKQMKLL